MSDEEMGNEIDVLFDLYYDVGARLCERLGHDWKTIDVRTGKVMNTSYSFDRCNRCNEERRTPPTSSGTQTTWERGP